MARQYRDASKLEARVSLHRLFSTNEQSLQRWEFDRFELPPRARVLELGCGPGYLWTENRGRVPGGWSIVLTDNSPGMLHEAEDNLGPDRRFVFRVVDAQEIPFQDGAFDAVTANHMLYHVPDRDRAISEIARVLKPDGVFYVATNGEEMHKEMAWMQRVLDPTRGEAGYFRDLLGFNLENGGAQLSRQFPEVSLRRFEDALVITETKPLADYLLSGTAADVATDEAGAEKLRRRAAELEERLERELAEHGEIRITKDVGMFVARK